MIANSDHTRKKVCIVLLILPSFVGKVVCSSAVWCSRIYVIFNYKVLLKHGKCLSQEYWQMFLTQEHSLLGHTSATAVPSEFLPAVSACRFHDRLRSGHKSLLEDFLALENNSLVYVLFHFGNHNTKPPK